MQELIEKFEILDHGQFQASATAIDLDEIKSEINALIRSLNNDFQLVRIGGNPKLEYILSTDICELVKHYMLYLRNLSIEKIHAQAKFKSSRLNETSYKRYLEDQLKEYHRTTKDFREQIGLTLSQVTDPNVEKTIGRDSVLVDNPSEIYKEQFQTLKLQIQKILSYDFQLRNLVLRFNYLRNTIHKEIDKELTKSGELQNSFETLFNMITTENPDITEIEDHLKKIERTIEAVRLDINFEESLAKVVNELGSIRLIKDYHQGMLYINEVDTSSQLKRWVSYSIMPRLKEINSRLRIHSEQSSRFIHSLIVAKDAERASEEILVDNPNELVKRKNENEQVIQTSINDLTRLKEQITHHLSIESMINNDQWSDSAFLNTYTQVVSNTESVFLKFRLFIDQVATKINNYLDRYDYNIPSVNEQIVDYLKLRTPEAKESLYQKVFFDASRFKDHYLVQRQDEFDKMLESIEDWDKGFGNSLLCYGKIQCGKTSFLQSFISAELFDQYIVIKPNSALTIEGRKFEIQHDLDDTLIEIKKHLSVNQTYCIVIDDLELWFDPDYSLYAITNAMIKHIDRAPTNVFFLISANSRFVERMNTILNFRSVFTWELELSRMQSSEFVETVLNRNETAQHVLLENNKIELSRSEIVKAAKQVFTANGEIVGCALQHWVGIIEKPAQVIKSIAKSPVLPTIVNSENLKLLDLILLHKSIAQIELINMIPKNDRDYIRNQIGRLVKLNIIQRAQNGVLSLTPLVIHELYEQTSFHLKKEEQFSHFLLGSVKPIEEDFSTIRKNVLENLIYFPFKSAQSTVIIDRLKDEVQISIKAMETPSQVLKYLDSCMENIQFEFKSRLA